MQQRDERFPHHPGRHPSPDGTRCDVHATWPLQHDGTVPVITRATAQKDRRDRRATAAVRCWCIALLGQSPCPYSLKTPTSCVWVSVWLCINARHPHTPFCSVTPGSRLIQQTRTLRLCLVNQLRLPATLAVPLLSLSGANPGPPWEVQPETLCVRRPSVAPVYTHGRTERPECPPVSDSPSVLPERIQKPPIVKNNLQNSGCRPGLSDPPGGGDGPGKPSRYPPPHPGVACSGQLSLGRWCGGWSLKMDQALPCTLVGRVGGQGCSLPPARKILRRRQSANTLSEDISATRSP